MSVFSKNKAEVIEMRPKPTLVVTSTPDNVADLRNEFKARERRGRIDRFLSAADVIGIITRATSPIPVRDEAIDAEGRMIDYRKRRVATLGLGLAATVGGVFGLGYIADGNDASAPATPNRVPPVVCEFSEETFRFVPKPGQGWMHAVQQTEGAMDDAACYTQELEHLQDTYGQQPQLELRLTPYADGYPIPAEVERVTTTTTLPS